MKIKIIHALLIAVIFMTAISCGNSESGISRNVTGRPGDVVVVIRDDAWEGNIGASIRNTLAQEHVALPQDEPLFDLVNVPREGFTSIFRTSRNVVQVRVSPGLDTFGITFQENLWARPQAIVTIQAKTENDFLELFDENKEKIISFFLKAERDRLKGNYRTYYEKGVYNVYSRYDCSDFDCFR